MDTQKIAQLLRYYSLASTTRAGSGHPTSCLSAADLMAVLYFQFFKYDFDTPHNLHNDRLIFSKGHAAPLLYSLFKLAGAITEEELMSLRTISSPMQGHPTPDCPYIDFATGSLGIGLSNGIGLALGLSHLIKKEEEQPFTYVLMGDGEMSEGSVWESIQFASYKKLSRLIGIIDVNGVGQTGETMVGHNPEIYKERISAFGWNTVVVDGHNHQQITEAILNARQQTNMPTMIIANTIKGKGVSFLENNYKMHAKVVSVDQLQAAKKELQITSEDEEQTFNIEKPASVTLIQKNDKTSQIESTLNQLCIELIDKKEDIATRNVYGLALARLMSVQDTIIALDGDLSNSTFSVEAQKIHPDRFHNIFIAEQNMIGIAVGLAALGLKPYASTFGSFMTRAFDQIRMGSQSLAEIKLCGSHVGVTMGEDGASQMGMEDIAMMRSVINSTVIYPSDAISTAKLIQATYDNKNITYIRTTRPATQIIYSVEDTFPIGGSKTLRSTASDVCTVVAAGVTLHEALKAWEALSRDGIDIRVIDAYSVKPIDERGLKIAANATDNKVIVVEDHYFEGGLGDAVLNVFATLPVQVYKMAVMERPHSGKGAELLERFGISAEHIVAKVKSLM